LAKNSYENAGAISLGMTAEQAAKRRAELAKSQHPFAIILSCSDSRVPPEIVFDEGLEICSSFELRATRSTTPQ